MKRVVGDEPFPGQIPQRLDRLARIPAAGGIMDRAEERCAVRPQVLGDRRFALIELPTGRRVRLQADRVPIVRGARLRADR